MISSADVASKMAPVCLRLHRHLLNEIGEQTRPRPFQPRVSVCACVRVLGCCRDFIIPVEMSEETIARPMSNGGKVYTNGIVGFPLRLIIVECMM